MTTTNPPPKTAASEWIKVFHAEGTENYTSSVTFTKQLTVVALSTLTYMKNLFPEDCYKVEYFAGIKLKLLKDKCSDELAQFLGTSLDQAFEAMDKKYLQRLALCFYEDNSYKLENLIEYHSFDYSYNPEGIALEIQSSKRSGEKRSVKCTFEDVKNKTTKLIRVCLVYMQACQQELPADVDICLRLYYNDDAPEGYQAPGYHCDEAGPDHLESTSSGVIQLGAVQTPYHKIVAKTYMRDFDMQDSREAIPSPNAPVMTQTQPQNMELDVTVTIHRSVTDSSGLQLRCPCNKYEDIGNDEAPLLITCHYCNTLQHAACFGLLADQVSRLTQHCCTVCVDEDRSRPHTDPRLAQLSARKRECLGMFRRTLEWCSKLTSIDCARLMKRFSLSTVNAVKLIKLLGSYGIVRLDSDSDLVTPKPINKEQLSVQIGKYFQNDAETSLADRLLAETFGSQESNCDPVGEVLSPLERITLQNTAILGRVITNPDLNKTADTATGDTTLQQYREAILSGGPVYDEMSLEKSRMEMEMVKGAKKVGKRKVADSTTDGEAGKKPRVRIGVKNRKAKGSKK